MEENYKNESLNSENDSEEEESELTHTDKLVGIFTEPVATFSKMAKSDARHSDWFLPVILLIIVAALSNFIMMSNPYIKNSIIEKQMSKIEQSLQQAVDEGKMSKEQAGAQLDTIRENMDKNMAAGRVFQVIGMVIFIFGSFFLISLFYWLVSRFGLKGEGTYADTMVAFGLPYYISIIQVIIMVILALSMNKFFQGTSVASFMDSDTSTITGFLLSKLDIFSIWFYIVVSIGLAKMFKSENTGKYYAMVFGSWIGVSLIFFFLAKTVPFLKFFMP